MHRNGDIRALTLRFIIHFMRNKLFSTLIIPQLYFIPWSVESIGSQRAQTWASFHINNTYECDCNTLNGKYLCDM